MKRVFSILIALCAIVSAYAQSSKLEIWTVSDLSALRYAVNSGDTYAGKTVKLMADLYLGTDGSPINWEPIGKEDLAGKNFSGTFDGQGYTITMYTLGDRTVAGLFGYLYTTAKVKHLKVAGRITNTSTLTSSTAGIAAYNRGTISECANLATIIGTTAGGIAGENHGTITNCYNRGNIRATDGYADTYYLGGIAGANKSSAISYTYVNCTIDDKNSPGGIVANNQSGTISNSYFNVLLDNGSSTYAMTGNTTLTGTNLNGKLNTSGDYSIWTFTAGQLPKLTCFTNKIVRIGDNNDNSAILTNNDGKKCTVELTNRTLYKDGKWNTLCLPFDVDNISSSPLAGATIKEMDGTKTNLDSNGKLTLKFNTATSIEAGKPYIIMWEPGTDLTNVQFSGVTIKNTDPTTKAVTFSNAFGSNGEFVGNYSQFSITNSNKDQIVLLSGDNTLGYSQSTRKLHTCRAHFMIPTTSSGIRAMMDFDIDFDDEEVTAIANLKSQISSLKPESWFTLQGVKLGGKPTQRGIYLHNGRKEAIR